MQQDIERFLILKAPPGRSTAERAAWFLGFSAREIPILVNRGLLKPLGRPAHNGQKYFLAATLEELRRDEKWFANASAFAEATVGRTEGREGLQGDPLKRESKVCVPIDGVGIRAFLTGC